MVQLKEKERNVKLMSEVENQIVTWFWYPYIPCGRITVVHGRKGCGKSLFAARLMAACTNKKSLEGMEEISPCNVLYLSADMDLSNLVKPRLVQAGADLSRIYAVNDTLPITLGDNSMEQIVESYDIRMVIIDPIQEYLEYDVYQDPPALIYSVLIKLEKLAKKSGCAVVLIADSEGVGSRQADVWKYEFAGTISSVLCLERLKNESGEITLLHEKCMLASEELKRTFRLDDWEANFTCSRSKNFPLMRNL